MAYETERPKIDVIVLIIVMAIVLAVALFLAISFVRRRPEAPPGTQTVVVEGQEVVLQPDPAQAVRLLPEPLEQPAQIEPTAEPTAPPPAQEEPPPPTPPPPTATPQPPAVSPIIFQDYQVAQEDTLYSIAQRFDTSITLIATHGISSKDLQPGAVIKLPIGNPAFCPNHRPYAVAESENVFRIAQRLGTTKEHLRDLNNLNENYAIDAGQILCVP